MYPKILDSQSKRSLKIFGKNEDKINYIFLSHKMLFPDSTFHIINFLNKYNTHSSLMEGLVTRKMTVNSTKVDQMSFIINLMNGYDEGKMYGIKELKRNFFHNTILTKANDIFLLKRIQEKK